MYHLQNKDWIFYTISSSDYRLDILYQEILQAFKTFYMQTLRSLENNLHVKCFIKTLNQSVGFEN